MKFCIAKDKVVVFGTSLLPEREEDEYSYEENDDDRPSGIRSGRFQVTEVADIIPVLDAASGLSGTELSQELAKKVCKKLGAIIKFYDDDSENSTSGSHRKRPRSRSQSSLNEEGQGYFEVKLRLLDKSAIQVTLVGTSFMRDVEAILQVHPEFTELKLSGELLWRRVSGGGDLESESVNPSDMSNFGTLEPETVDFDDVARFTVDSSLAVATYSQLREIWESPSVVIVGKFTVELMIEVDEEVFMDKNISDKMCITRKLLAKAIGSDVKIITDNGAIIPCHTSFLSAHSPAFAAMLNRNFKEAETKEIKMPGKSDEGIRALLEYLYHWDTSEPAADPMLAIELYQIGHEYDIKLLQACMVEILEAKNESFEDWMDLDAALNLFPFGGSLEDCQPIKKAVLNCFKMNVNKMRQSKRFREIFETNPNLAMDLFQEVCGWIR